MEADERRKWALLSSHGHVLVEIARNPQARVRDISAIIGITERATQAIIADLERAGYVERMRIGRRTHYVLHPDNAFRHSAQDGLQVGPFLDLLTATGATGGLATDDSLLAGIAAAASGSEMEPELMPGPGPMPGPDPLPAEVIGFSPAPPPLLPPATETGAGPTVVAADLPQPGTGID
jgi:hypothetical protein